MNPFDYLRLNYNITEALGVAKQVLQNHLDFIILEHFDEPRTLRILQDALHNDLSASKSFMQNKDNGGVRAAATSFATFGKGSISMGKSVSSGVDKENKSKVTRYPNKTNASKSRTGLKGTTNNVTSIPKLVLVTKKMKMDINKTASPMKLLHNDNNTKTKNAQQIARGESTSRRLQIDSSTNISSRSRSKDTKSKRVDNIVNVNKDDSRGPRYSYRNDMPPAVVRFLEKDNAADLEFYRFAVQEFERRTKQEHLQDG